MRATLKTTARAGQSVDFAALWVFIKASWLTVFLSVSIVVSAFVLIYVKDLNRRLFIESQGLQQQHQHLVNQWGKLLLEQSTWSAQTRIQTVAQGNLGMVMPAPKQVVILADKE